MHGPLNDKRFYSEELG